MIALNIKKGLHPICKSLRLVNGRCCHKNLIAQKLYQIQRETTSKTNVQPPKDKKTNELQKYCFWWQMNAQYPLNEDTQKSLFRIVLVFFKIMLNFLQFWTNFFFEPLLWRHSWDNRPKLQPQNLQSQDLYCRKICQLKVRISNYGVKKPTRCCFIRSQSGPVFRA